MCIVRSVVPRWVAVLLLASAPLALDTADPEPESAPGSVALSACEGNRPPLPSTLTFELGAGAFPGSGHPDAAVHVPPGFDATRRPGVIVYFHGWNGCVTTALADENASCTDDGEVRTASAIAAQIDAARVNALLVAVELRVDLPTGEPGRIAMPGGLRDLLRELFTDHLAESLGCALDVDGLDRVVLMAHSGGYQAAASALRYGDVDPITEVDLLDALYGADDIFADWLALAARGDDPRLRFVDLYTSGGGTAERSRAFAARAHRMAFEDLVRDDDTSGRELTDDDLARPIVFKRVPIEHGMLPRAYVGQLARAAGFAPLRSPQEDSATLQ
jgi:hypothetical protein